MNTRPLTPSADPVVLRCTQLIGDGEKATQAFAEVATEFGLKASAVRMRFYRAQGKRDKEYHRNRKLTPDQTQLLRIVVLSFSATNAGLNTSLVVRATKTLFDKECSRRWVRDWLASQRDAISLRKSKHLARQRNNPELLEEVASFVAAVEVARERSRMEPHNVVNFDETRVCLGSSGELVVEWSGKQRAQAQGTAITCFGSFLPFIGADGAVHCSFYVLRGKPEDSDGNTALNLVTPKQEYLSRGSWPRYFTVTATGYLDNNAFALCAKKFADIWALHHPSQRCFAFADQLAQHNQLEVTKYAAERGVHIWLLPAHTSHFLQPLDAQVFAVFKRTLREHAYEVSLEATFGDVDPQTLFFSLVYEAEEQALSRRTVLKSFKSTGIVPWDPEVIMSLARANLSDASNQPLNVSSLESLAVESCVLVINDLKRTAEERQDKCRKYKSKIRTHELHEPLRRIEFQEAQKKAKEDRVEQARQNKEAKKEVKRQQEAQKLLRVCAVEGCGKRWRSSPSWVSCPNCSRKLCPSHRDNLPTHQQQCGNPEPVVGEQ